MGVEMISWPIFMTECLPDQRIKPKTVSHPTELPGLALSVLKLMIITVLGQEYAVLLAGSGWRIFFFFHFYLGFRARQDYFQPSQSWGGAKMGDPWEKTSDHPQAELGLWPELGSNSQPWDDDWFRVLKISVLNHSATGATYCYPSCVLSLATRWNEGNHSSPCLVSQGVSPLSLIDWLYCKTQNADSIFCAQCIQCYNDHKFSDRQAWASSANPFRSGLIRVYTVCHSICIFWEHIFTFKF